MEDVIRKGQERLKNLIPGGFGSYKGIVLVVLLGLVIWLVTGFFRVQPNQQAIQLVFGKPYGKPVEPGLHYNLPGPIGNVVVVNVQDQRRVVIGSRGGQDRTTTYTRGPRPTSTENLMLTSDENIVDIEFAVLWQIKDVFNYAFDVRNPEENVRAGAEAAMREVIGRSNLQYAQTEGRSRIEQDTKDLLQRILDEYGLGVRISNIQLLRVDPPQEVIPAFRDVQAARADKEKSINEANTYRNQVLPRAKGEAESIIQRGEAYKAEIIARASGDAQRFDQVYEQWAKAKDITTERLYLDTMEEVLRNVNKVMIDKNSSPAALFLTCRCLSSGPASRRHPYHHVPPLRRRERRDDQPFDHRADRARDRRLPGDPDLLHRRSDQAGAGAPVRRHRRRSQDRARPLCQDPPGPGHPAHRSPAARLRSRGV
jgi:membrane protease subunit HflK